MSACPDRETLAAYVDRRLGAAERDGLEAHLADCSACRAETVAMVRLVRPSGAVDRPRTPVPRIGTRRRVARLQRLRLIAAGLTAAAAAALVAVALRTALPAPPERAQAQAPPVPPPPPAVRTKEPPVSVDKPAPVPPPPAPSPKPAAGDPGPVTRPVPRPEPAPAPAPEPPAPVPPPAEPVPAPAPKPVPPAPAAPTRTVVARLQDVEGPVMLGGRPAADGAEILEGVALAVGPRGSAQVLYADGTRLALDAETTVPRFYDEEGPRLELGKGAIRAQVARQAPGRAFAVVTPHGEARVIGTAFLITVGGDATRVAVEEGKVRLNGLDVTAGHLAVATPTAPTAVRPVTSLLGHWTLDEGRGRTAFDSTGLGNDAVLRDKTDWAPGRTGSGVECGKGGIYVPVFHAPGPPLGEGYTAALWVYHDKLDAWQDVYFSMPGLAIVREGNLDAGRVRVTVRVDGTAVDFANDGVVRPRQWMHLAVTWDGAVARLYRNGRSAAFVKAKGSLPPPRSMGINAGSEVEGRIDDVRLYRRALSAAEIAQIMNGGEVR